jgi:hypothetical protein
LNHSDGYFGVEGREREVKKRSGEERKNDLERNNGNTRDHAEKSLAWK